MDVIALVGTLRYREHRSVPEIHQELSRRGVAICERSVLLERYDELVAASAGAAHRETLERQGRAILAIDGLQTSVTRCCGSSARACPGWSCWLAPCCRRPAPISPVCFARSRRNWPLLGFLSSAWSAFDPARRCQGLA